MAEKVTACGSCGDTGWVCEEHPDQSWPHSGCGSAGEPCPVCNKTIGPDDRPDVSRLGFVPAAGELVGGIAPENEAEHFMRCPKCGAPFDLRDLNQVLLHDGPLPHPIGPGLGN